VLIQPTSIRAKMACDRKAIGAATLSGQKELYLAYLRPWSGALRMIFAIGALLGLSGCGVADDPEKGPVVLLCDGEEIAKGANGDQEQERKRQFYRINGAEGTIQTWDDSAQQFNIGSRGLTVSATEARYKREMPAIAGIASTKTITFDRVSGRVVDESVMSNGGSLRFLAACKPVKDPASAAKF